MLCYVMLCYIMSHNMMLYTTHINTIAVLVSTSPLLFCLSSHPLQQLNNLNIRSIVSKSKDNRG